MLCRTVTLVAIAASLLGIATTAPAQSGETQVDRLLAAVNGKVITQSDLELAGNLNAVLLFGRGSPASDAPQELERLVDQELLQQELESFGVQEGEESYVQAHLEELRKGYAEIGGLPVLLRRLGLQESELIAYLRLQARILKFINFRFSPFVSVSDAEVQSYYAEKFVPELRAAGSRVPPSPEVEEKIRRLLTEEKVNASLDVWFENARSGSRIEYFSSDAASKDAPRQ
jgi:hypothetical protein